MEKRPELLLKAQNIWEKMTNEEKREKLIKAGFSDKIFIGWQIISMTDTEYSMVDYLKGKKKMEEEIIKFHLLVIDITDY